MYRLLYLQLKLLENEFKKKTFIELNQEKIKENVEKLYVLFMFTHKH